MRTTAKSGSSDSGEEHEYRFRVRLKKGASPATGKGEKQAARSFLRAVNLLCSSTSFGHSRHRHAATAKGSFARENSRHAQRVMVKTRLVKGASLKSLSSHIGYITRPGVAREEGVKVEVYGDAAEDLTRQDLNRWADKTTSDRHQFWLIVSPENSAKLELKEYTATLIEQMEKDLETQLDWVAVNHYNTDTAHVHLMIRGKDGKGKDLVISRDYIANGIRNRAQEIATARLGLRSDLEIRAGLSADITKQRLTQIDRDLLALQRQNAEKTVDLRFPRHRQETGFALFKRGVRLQRVQELQKLDLARQVKPGVWRLADETEKVLQELGERGDIIKTMHRALTNYPRQERVIFDPDNPQQESITGIVVEKGLRDELYGDHYLVVAAADNRSYYVPLSRYSETPGQASERGSRVQVTVSRTDAQRPRATDRNIMEQAQQNGGIYDSKEHLRRVNRHRLPRGVTAEQYLENHTRRMEALEKKGLAQNIGAGKWRIPPDLSERIEELALKQEGRNFVQVKLSGLERKKVKDLAF